MTLILVYKILAALCFVSTLHTGEKGRKIVEKTKTQHQSQIKMYQNKIRATCFLLLSIETLHKQRNIKMDDQKHCKRMTCVSSAL